MFGLIRTTIIAVVLAFNTGSILAQDFQKGFAAAQSGDYVTALQEWRPLAEQGDATSQNNLGVMYENGKGVLQDNVRSHIWYNIAAANGNEKSGKWRDQIAAKMTSADISKAQSMARECMSSNYKNCGW
jgi:uncharacterized protein